MEIVQLGLDDIDRVFELSNQLENDCLNFDQFKPCYYEIVSLNNHIIYGVKLDEIVGYIHLRLERQLHHAALVVEVLELIVDDKHRSKHYGKRLLDFAVNYSKSIGASHIELTTNVIRERAHHFYVREGFNQTSLKFVRNIRS
ncbi:MAG: GNAT family N-acetyltransferase [Erysipelotrichaceae bacterium]